MKMSSTIVNTLIDFGLEDDQADILAADFARMHDEARAEMSNLSRQIDALMAEFGALEERAKRMEAALAPETHPSVVPLHGVGK